MSEDLTMAKRKVPQHRQQTRPLPALFDQVKNIVIAELHQRLDELGFEGLRPRHGHVFRFIDDEGSRVTDLAARSGLTKQGIGDAVDELEELGYVERHLAAADRRAKTVRLTRRGMEAQAAASRVLEDIERRWARQYGREQIDQVRDTLEHIAANAQQP
jgi:DNA-binding MarR family transcriptional regulator